MKNVFSKTVLPFGLVLFITLIFSNTVSAQDNIIMRNNDVVKAKVEEVGVDVIRYHKFDNLDGPIYDMPKTDVYMILYANGTRDVINDQPQNTTPQNTAPQDNYTSVQDNQPAPNTPPVQPEQGGEVTMQTFYDQLSPYGNWMNTNDYGYVWVPNVGPDFRPYGTAGHWTFTEYGWTWVSDFPWGWAAFHYGRWRYEPEVGYMWIPETTWGPAWVSWRRSDEYYGWVPLGPRGYDFPQDHWCFVNSAYICNDHIYDHYERRENVVVIYNRTTIIQNNYVERGGVRYVAGPDRLEVEHVTHTTIAPVRIVSSNSPGQTVHERGELNIYRPVIHTSTTVTARPVEVTNRERIVPVTQRTTIVHPVVHNNNFNHNTQPAINRSEPANNNHNEPVHTQPINHTEPVHNEPANMNHAEPAHNEQPATINRSEPAPANRNNSAPEQQNTPNNNNSINRSEPAHQNHNTRPAQPATKPAQQKPAAKPIPTPAQHKK